MQYSDTEGLHKLFYSENGSSHGGLYFRCRTRDGWVFLIIDHGVSRPEGYRPIIRAGNAIELPSFRFAFDRGYEQLFIDIAIPADSQIFKEMAAGQILRVDGTEYPVTRTTEARTIANFQTVCGDD